MALTTQLPDNGTVATNYGIALLLMPGDPTWSIEIQRATDDGTGAPISPVSLQVLPPGPLSGVQYTDALPNDAQKRFYRIRHVRYGVQGNWTGYTAGIKPILLAEQVTSRMLRSTLATQSAGSVLPFAKVAGQNRTVVMHSSYICPNQEFDMWEN